jgi:hypothetical protein
MGKMDDVTERQRSGNRTDYSDKPQLDDSQSAAAWCFVWGSRWLISRLRCAGAAWKGKVGTSNKPVRPLARFWRKQLKD